MAGNQLSLSFLVDFMEDFFYHMQEIQAYIFPFCARIRGNTERQAGFSIDS